MHDSARDITPKRGSGAVPQRAAYRPEEVAVLLGGVGRRFVWTLIQTGELASFKTGRLRMVAQQDLDAYIDKQRDEQRKVREAAAATV